VSDADGADAVASEVAEARLVRVAAGLAPSLDSGEVLVRVLATWKALGSTIPPLVVRQEGRAA
jgi:hypothetical protein